MAGMAKKILLVDDEEKFLHSIAERLKLLGFNPLKASSGMEAVEIAKGHRLDLAIVDLKMPDMDGLVTIAKLKEIHPDLKSVLLTGYGDEKVRQATETLNADYFEKDQMGDFWDFVKQISKSGGTIVIKPPPPAKASDTLSREQEDAFPPGQIEVLPDYHPAGDAAGSGAAQRTVPGERLRMIGETLAMQDLRKNIERLAALDCPVIVRGETGTGKELAARIMHQLSPRRHNRLIAINCGCFSNDLLIEELIRPGPGVFSGSSQRGEGISQYASQGTILLDQIEEMSPKMQLAMLKIIDSQKISLQDGRDDFPFDVRIVAASRYNLKERVEEGKFREELYYRLNVFELFIPPLRERRDDIRPLCGYFLNKFSKEFNKGVNRVADEVVSIFMSYDFPGNVRELEHIIERGVILADGKSIECNHLPMRFHGAAPTTLDDGKKFMTLAEMEEKYIMEVLEASGGNKSKTTKLLGISRAALWRKLKKFKEEKHRTTAAVNKGKSGK